MVSGQKLREKKTSLSQIFTRRSKKEDNEVDLFFYRQKKFRDTVRIHIVWISYSRTDPYNLYDHMNSKAKIFLYAFFQDFFFKSIWIPYESIHKDNHTTGSMGNGDIFAKIFSTYICKENEISNFGFKFGNFPVFIFILQKRVLLVELFS